MLELPCTCFDAKRTLECGQAFRWRPYKNGYFGVSGDMPLYVEADENMLRLDCPERQLEYWKSYFAADMDYSELIEMLQSDDMTRPCLQYSTGIHVLCQQPFEALISFIISANNNVRRISGIIERLCARCGKAGVYEDIEYHAFPTPEALAVTDEQTLVEIGAGYRAPYIKKSAGIIAGGYDLEALRKLDFEQAKKELLAFPGVGPKVAECVMLFSLGFGEAFPVDVWVKRIVDVLNPEGGRDRAAQCAARYGKWAGAAQQYLFNYAREVGLGKDKGKV